MPNPTNVYAVNTTTANDKKENETKRRKINHFELYFANNRLMLWTNPENSCARQKKREKTKNTIHKINKKKIFLDGCDVTTSGSKGTFWLHKWITSNRNNFEMSNFTTYRIPIKKLDFVSGAKEERKTHFYESSVRITSSRMDLRFFLLLLYFLSYSLLHTIIA